MDSKLKSKLYADMVEVWAKELLSDCKTQTIISAMRTTQPGNNGSKVIIIVNFEAQE